MAMRLTGLMSGMDTESIINELVQVRRTKVDAAKKAQTKLGWKQDAWKDLNAQVLKLYNGSLGNMRFESSFIKKTTKVSNPNAVSVITGEGAMNSVQNLKITDLACSAYMTGGSLQEMTAPGQTAKYTEEFKTSSSLTASVEDGGLGLKAGSKITVNVNGENTSIEITEGMTIKGFFTALQKAGLNASFDEKNQRFFISSKETGEKQSFTITGANADGIAALDSLGISSYTATEKAYYEKIIADKDETLTSRKASKLESLVDEREELLDEQKDMLDTLKKYSDITSAKGVDLSVTPLNDDVLDAIQKAIDSIENKTSDQKKDLSTWVADYKASRDSLEKIEAEQLKKVTYADGSTGYELADALVEEIENEVQEEVDYAQTALTAMATAKGTAAHKMEGSDAKITLNGVEYSSNSNTFEINGLTMTVNAKTADNEEITITTEDDTEGIYDMVKKFLKEYNELVTKMDTLYNADAAKDYEPLTDEEKEEMSEKAVEEWEKKIKDALLRKDSTLGTLNSSMKEIMMSGVSVGSDTMYLSDFGINTLNYFLAGENERGVYHIDGDSDDTYTSGNTDKLKSMIATDPDKVVSFFTGLSKKLYSKMTDLMRATDYSSSYTIYDDKKMKEDYNDYKSKIAELEKKLNDYEDSWYKKFAAMETAMAKMQSNASAVTNMLGGF